MTDSRPGAPREWFQWDGAMTTLGIFIAILCALYFSIYAPSWVIPVAWQWFVLAGFGMWMTYFVLLPKFALAILGARTGILATMDGVWRVSETSLHELDPLTARVDYAALRASGVRIPKELEAVLKNHEKDMPQPGVDEKGRVIRAWFSKAGGYRLAKVWYDEPGADGFHLFIGFKPIDIGGKKRGGCLISPCKPVAVPHEALPERWRQQLREDHMWVDSKPGKLGTAVWVHVEPSPGFIQGMLETAEYWKPFFDAAPEKKVGTLSALAAYALWADALMQLTHMTSNRDQLWNENDRLRSARSGQAGAVASLYGRRESPVGYRHSDEIPSEPVRVG